MRTQLPEIFSEQMLACGEGPVWDTEKQLLYWTDSAGEAVFVKPWKGGETNLYLQGIHAASLVQHERGGLMLCGKKGFYHFGEDRKNKYLDSVCEGVAVENINDLIADSHGRIFGGQEAFREHEDYKPGYLFRVDPGGQIHVVEEGLHLSNGMGFSPGLDIFYLADTIAGMVYRYDYNPMTGEISNRKILVKIDRNEGMPDGITVDASGFIWVARWFGHGISRYDPDGKLERSIDVPVAQPSSLTFGGPDMNEIYVTSAAVQWESELAPVHHDFSTPRGGSVYRIVQDIQGKPEFKAKI
jgi:sugar lactone lactonase YvrE